MQIKIVAEGRGSPGYRVYNAETNERLFTILTEHQEHAERIEALWNGCETVGAPEGIRAALDALTEAEDGISDLLFALHEPEDGNSTLAQVRAALAGLVFENATTPDPDELLRAIRDAVIGLVDINLPCTRLAEYLRNFPEEDAPNWTKYPEGTDQFIIWLCQKSAPHC